VRRGSDLDTGAEAGTLLVPHLGGWVLAWIDRAGQEDTAMWGARVEARALDVKPPALVRLESAGDMAIAVDRPTMLHFRSPVGLVTRLERPGQEPRVEIHAGGARYDAYLEAGRSTLSVRALGGQALSGVAEITTSDVMPIGEGLGPEVILGPGATRVFSFQVARTGPVGVGVRASAEIVEAVLMNARGETVGRGTAQMPTLEAGTYLLALQAPSDAVPVTARASLVGLKLPDVGPPSDVIRKYVAPEEEVPGFTSAHAEEPSRTPSYRASGDQSTEGSFEPQGQWEGEGGGEMAEGGEETEETTETEGGQQ
jgi:hypothetical protein